MYRILLLFILLIVHGSLYPWRFEPRDVNPFVALLHAWRPIGSKRLIADAAANVVFYVPLGMAAYIALSERLRRRASAAGALLLAFCLSAAMEMLQLWAVSRNCAASDLVCNVLGAGFGVAAAVVLRDRCLPGWTRRGFRVIDPAAMALLCCWLGYQFFPAVPETGRLILWSKAVEFFRPVPFPLLGTAVAAAEWLAIDRLLDAAGAWARRLLPLVALVLLAKPLMTGRTVTWPELAGAVLVIALGRRMEVPPAAAAAALCGALLLNGLHPFRLAGAPARFHWVPLQAFIAANWELATAVLLRKLFWYGSLVWLLERAGVRLSRAVAAVAVVLGAIEAVQVYLPVHVPESTDPVLAVLMGFVFYALEEHARRHAGAMPGRAAGAGSP